jgi:hypothetical protein
MTIVQMTDELATILNGVWDETVDEAIDEAYMVVLKEGGGRPGGFC